MQKGKEGLRRVFEGESVAERYCGMHGQPASERSVRTLAEQLGYMARLPCASLSQRSNILTYSMSGASAESGNSRRVVKSDEGTLEPGASRRGKMTGLRPVPRPVLG